jgi:CRISPR-associated protein Csm3
MEENKMSNQQITNGKLIKKILIKGKIHALTGLHIGATNAGMSIGGVDAAVVRNPLTRRPYIPGSSLKGKMRSLLEKVEGKVTNGSNNLAGELFIVDITNPIAQIFGVTPEDVIKQKQPKQPVSRLIVRDCPLNEKSAKKLLASKDTDMPYTEVKTEVVIDRITSAATPRPLERVPAGAIFEMEMILNVYDGDNETTFLNKIFEGLALVQNDYLGGKGSRGSGQVKISVTELKKKEKEDYEQNKDWQAYTFDIPAELKHETDHLNEHDHSVQTSLSKRD